MRTLLWKSSRIQVTAALPKITLHLMRAQVQVLLRVRVWRSLLEARIPKQAKKKLSAKKNSKKSKKLKKSAKESAKATSSGKKEKEKEKAQESKKTSSKDKEKAGPKPIDTSNVVIPGFMRTVSASAKSHPVAEPAAKRARKK